MLGESAKYHIWAKNESGNTLLHDAVYAGQAEAVKRLLAALDDFNLGKILHEVGGNGETVFHAAALVSNLEVVKALVDKLGVDKSRDLITMKTSTYGDTVLQIASNNDNVKMLDYFVSTVGVSAKDVIRDGHNSHEEHKRGVRKSVIEKLTPVVEKIIPKVEKLGDQVGNLLTKVVDKFNNNNVLHDAVIGNKNIDKLRPFPRELLWHRNLDHATPLHLAAMKNDDNHMLKRFIQVADLKGSDIQSILAGAADADRTLHVACEIGNEFLVSLLLAEQPVEGDDPNCNIMKPDKKFLGNTAIHAAAIGGNLKVLQLLLDAREKADVNCINWYGQTPLHLAAAEGNYEAVEFLVARGCNVGQEDHAGATPFHFAARGKGSKAVLELLKKSLGNEFEGSVNKATRHAGLTPLHYAAWNGNDVAIRWLIGPEAEANIEVEMEGIDHVEELTPCMWAALGDHPNYRAHMANMLIDDISKALHIDEGKPKFVSKLSEYLVKAYIDEGKNPLVNKPKLFPKGKLRVPCFNPIMCALTWYVLHQTDEALELRTLTKSASYKLPLTETLALCAVVYTDTYEITRRELALHYKRTDDFYIMLETVHSLQLAVFEDRANYEELYSRILMIVEAGERDGSSKVQTELESALNKALDKRALKEKFFTDMLQSMRPFRVFELLQHRLENESNFCKDRYDSEELSPLDKSKLTRADMLVEDIPISYWVAYIDAGLNEVKRLMKDYGRKEGAKLSAISYLRSVAEKVSKFKDYTNYAGRHTGRTALHWAAIFGELEIVRELCKVDRCKKDVKDCFGKPPYSYAALHKNKFEIDEFVEFVNLLKWDTFSESFYKDRDFYVKGLNAILVGAALIAAVTFAGILAPPLQYPVKSNSTAIPELKYVAIVIPGVQIFWVCASLSFLFSMASAVASVTGTLPNTTTSPFDFDLYELERIRTLLMLAATFLVISIAFVLIAFAAAGFTVLPNHLKLQANMIATIPIGGVLCIYMLVRFGRAVYKLTPDNFLSRTISHLKPYARNAPNPNLKKLKLAGVAKEILPAHYDRKSIHKSIRESGGFAVQVYLWDDGLWNFPFAAPKIPGEKPEAPMSIVCE